MEAVADVENLDTVYGIVTNYIGWIFFQSHNDKVERDFNTLRFENEIPTVDSLKRIAGKIYAMLSDD